MAASKGQQPPALSLSLSLSRLWRQERKRERIEEEEEEKGVRGGRPGRRGFGGEPQAGASQRYVGSFIHLRPRPSREVSDSEKESWEKFQFLAE